MNYRIYLADAFAWLQAREENSIHAIVTDPPYGLKEFTDSEKAKLRSGRGESGAFPRHSTAASVARYQGSRS